MTTAHHHLIAWVLLASAACGSETPSPVAPGDVTDSASAVTGMSANTPTPPVQPTVIASTSASPPSTLPSATATPQSPWVPVDATTYLHTPENVGKRLLPQRGGGCPKVLSTPPKGVIAHTSPTCSTWYWGIPLPKVVRSGNTYRTLETNEPFATDEAFVVDSATDYTELYRCAMGPMAPAPEIDFASQQVVVTRWTTTSSRQAAVEVRAVGNEIVILLREGPASCQGTPQRNQIHRAAFIVPKPRRVTVRSCRAVQPNRPCFPAPSVRPVP